MKRSPARRKAARPFAAHPFRRYVSFMHEHPRIFLSREAQEKMWHFTDIAPKEAGWLGTVTRRGNDFFVSDVFLFSQTVRDEEMVITESGLSDFAMELLERENSEELWNNIRLWGHSHVWGGVSPSLTDDQQMGEFAASEHPWFIRVICNKLGTMSFDLYWYESGIIVYDVPWSLHTETDASLRASLEEEFARKVRVARPKKRTGKRYVVYAPSDVAAPEDGGEEDCHD